MTGNISPVTLKGEGDVLAVVWVCPSDTTQSSLALFFNKVKKNNRIFGILSFKLLKTVNIYEK